MQGGTGGREEGGIGRMARGGGQDGLGRQIADGETHFKQMHWPGAQGTARGTETDAERVVAGDHAGENVDADDVDDVNDVDDVIDVIDVCGGHWSSDALLF
jgi:hypothetical protein